MAAHTHDDAFHEIQLNGKQLVFLVMAATVVSVAIFLCGVLVGRNVRAAGAGAMQASLAESPAADSTPPAPQPAAVEDVRTAAPPPPVNDASATAAAADDAAVNDVLKPAAPRPDVPVEKPAAPAVAAAAPAAEKAPAKAADKPTPKAADKASAKPAESPAPAAATPGNGFAVQVAALNARGEADAIAKRLNAKGYAAYVQAPGSGTPSIFRVRIGTFKTRREAESVATRLQKEEQFKPWVTR